MSAAAPPIEPRPAPKTPDTASGGELTETAPLNQALRRLKRIVIAMTGGTVLLIGLALVFLPGPAFIVIPAGLSILAVEFEWSRRWLKRTKALIRRKTGIY